MRIEDFIWLDAIVEKLESKHAVSTDEVEQVFENRPHFRYISKGRVRKAKMYMLPTAKPKWGGTWLCFSSTSQAIWL